jgi:hypothetical protein
MKIKVVAGAFGTGAASNYSTKIVQLLLYNTAFRNVLTINIFRIYIFKV